MIEGNNDNMIEFLLEEKIQEQKRVRDWDEKWSALTEDQKNEERKKWKAMEQEGERVESLGIFGFFGTYGA